MHIRVKRVQKGKLALISALTMTVISLLFYPFFLFPMSYSYSMQSFGGPGFEDFGFGFFRFFLIAMPVLYFIVGFIGTYIFLALFNLICRKTGGFKVELFDIETEEADEQVENLGL